jgi:hypothetical protein
MSLNLTEEGIGINGSKIIDLFATKTPFNNYKKDN